MEWQKIIDNIYFMQLAQCVLKFGQDFVSMEAGFCPETGKKALSALFELQSKPVSRHRKHKLWWQSS